MASRPRSQKKRGWPDGLYERNGYFTWRNPLTGKELAIGRVTVGDAKAQAAEANIHVQGLRDKPRLVDRLEGKEDRSWRAWLIEYEKIIGLVPSEDHKPEKVFAVNTAKGQRAQIKRIREVWAEQMGLPLERVTVKMIADGLKAIRSKTPRMAQTVRARLLESFNTAIVNGWTTANPVAVTEDLAAPVKRARLTWEVFQKLYAAMPAGRLKNATALALVSGQARETVCGAEFSQIGPIAAPGQPPVECWKVTRGKTGAMIAIPLELRLNAFGMSLGDVVKQCRATGIVSRYMIHNTVRVKGARLGTRYNLNTLTEEFSSAVAAQGIDWGNQTPPTFHELRSLSKRLYSSQGGVNTLELLGHADERTGQLYADGRGAEYRLVSLGF